MTLAPVIATETYEAQIQELLSFDEQAEMEFAIAATPEAHPVVSKTGGVRKARWSRPGMGKRGGLRVIYFYAVRAELVLMLTAYAKGGKEDLNDDDKKAIRKVVERFKTSLKT